MQRKKKQRQRFQALKICSHKDRFYLIRSSKCWMTPALLLNSSRQFQLVRRSYFSLRKHCQLCLVVQKNQLSSNTNFKRTNCMVVNLKRGVYTKPGLGHGLGPYAYPMEHPKFCNLPIIKKK